MLSEKLSETGRVLPIASVVLKNIYSNEFQFHLFLFWSLHTSMLSHSFLGTSSEKKTNHSNQNIFAMGNQVCECCGFVMRANLPVSKLFISIIWEASFVVYSIAYFITICQSERFLENCF